MITFCGRSVDNTQRSQMLAQNRDLCHAPPAFDAAISESPSEYRHDVRRGKTKIIWLRDGEKILKIPLFVLTEFTNVTVGQTDRWTADGQICRACIVSRGKNDMKPDRQRDGEIIIRHSSQFTVYLQFTALHQSISVICVHCCGCCFSETIAIC